MSTTRGSKRTDSPSGASGNPPAFALADFAAQLKKLGEQMQAMTDQQSALSKKIDSSSQTVTEAIDQKIEELQADLHSEFSGRLSQVEEDTKVLTRQGEELEDKCSDLAARVEVLTDQNDRCQARCSELADKLEFCEREADVIVRGVPLVRGENCFVYYQKIAGAIGFSPTEPLPKVDAFRLGRKKPGAAVDPPILLRFHDKYEKSEFFKRYLRKLNLKISDVGFDGDSRIFLGENLTQQRRNIFVAAMEMKKAKKLFAVKTKFGAVFVQRTEGGAVVPIRHLSEL